MCMTAPGFLAFAMHSAKGPLAMMTILACVISLGSAAAPGNATAGLPRVPLRVGLIQIHYPPWVLVEDGAIATKDSDYIGGFFVDFYRELGNTGNFDVTLVPIRDNNYLNDFTGVTMKLLDAGSGVDAPQTLGKPV